MPLAVFLKGVNVGGHRRFKPSEVAQELAHLDVVNIGAAGTFVVRGTRSHAIVRRALKRYVPFEAELMICDADEILELVASDPFKGLRVRTDIVRFVGILAKGGASPLDAPLTIPSTGDWCVKVLERRGRYVLGVHRRQMKAIGHLQRLETIFGSTITIRGWGTLKSVARLAS